MRMFDNLLGAGLRRPLTANLSHPDQQASTAAGRTAPPVPPSRPASVAPVPAEKEGEQGRRGDTEIPDAVQYRKGAGVWVPPGTSPGPIVVGDVSPAAPKEIVVKTHLRNVPAKEKSLLPDEITIDTLVAEFRRAQRATTQRVVLLGCGCERWIREQLKKRTALDRATAIKKIRAELAEAKLEKKEARVDLYVRCYWVATILGGWDAESQESRRATQELAFSALRLFCVLIERDRKTDHWQLVEAHAAAAKALWARAVDEKLSAAAIDAELSKILPARTLPIKKHRPVKIGFVLRLVPRLPIADVPTLIARLQDIQRQSLLEPKSA